MSAGGEVEVDIEELRAAGRVMLRTGDAVRAVAGAGALLGRSAYGSGALTDAAGRFADRFAYVLDGLGQEVVGAGEDLRTSATAYQEADIAARSCITRIRFPGLPTEGLLGGPAPGLGQPATGSVFHRELDLVPFDETTIAVHTPFDEAGT